MNFSIGVRCRSWLDSVMRGEIHLTADVLWLAEIDGEAPPRERSRPELVPPAPLRV